MASEPMAPEKDSPPTTTFVHHCAGSASMPTGLEQACWLCAITKRMPPLSTGANDSATNIQPEYGACAH